MLAQGSLCEYHSLTIVCKSNLLNMRTWEEHSEMKKLNMLFQTFFSRNVPDLFKKKWKEFKSNHLLRPLSWSTQIQTH